MGVLTDLVRMKSDQDTKAKLGTMDALKLVLTNPNASPEARQWANASLVGLLDGEFSGKGSKGTGGTQQKQSVFHQLLSGLDKMNPMTASQGTKQATQQIAQSRPQKMELTEDERAEVKRKQEEAQTKILVERDVAIEKGKRQADIELSLDPKFHAAQQTLFERDAQDAGLVKGTPEYTQYIEERQGVHVPRPLAAKKPGARKAVEVVGPDGKKFTGYLGQDETGADQLYKLGSNEPLDPSKYVQAEKEVASGDKGVLGELEAAERVVSDPKATPEQKKAAKLFIQNYQAGTSEKSLTAAFNQWQMSQIGGMGGAAGGGGSTSRAGSTSGPTAITDPIRQANVNEFIMRSLNPTMVGRDKYTSARMQAGMQELMKQTGMSAEQLATSLQERKADYKALSEAVQRFRAYQGLENRLVAHGDILKEARRKLPDAKLKILNGAINEGLKQVNDPEVNKYLIALNAVAREYATAISNGFQSRAMLPVSSSEEAAKILSSSLSTGAIDGIVDQMKVEVKASEEAMKKQQADILTDVARPISNQEQKKDPLGILK